MKKFVTLFVAIVVGTIAVMAVNTKTGKYYYRNAEVYTSVPFGNDSAMIVPVCRFNNPSVKIDFQNSYVRISYPLKWQYKLTKLIDSYIDQSVDFKGNENFMYDFIDQNEDKGNIILSFGKDMISIYIEYDSDRFRSYSIYIEL